MLALKDLQSLTGDVKITTEILDGPKEIDIVNFPPPYKFLVKDYEMIDYFKKFTSAAST